MTVMTVMALLCIVLTCQLRRIVAFPILVWLQSLHNDHECQIVFKKVKKKNIIGLAR